MRMNHTYRMSIAPPPESYFCKVVSYFEEGVLRTPSSYEEGVSL